VNQNFTADELKQAREDCQTETGKTPIQGDAKAAPTQTSTGGVVPPTPAAATSAAPAAVAPATAPGAQAQLQVNSTPDGADIEIDGSFVGNTPSAVGVAPGQHQLSVKKAGFKPWERKITVSSGQVNVNAMLEPAQ
jgi:hypothetical protein